MVDKISIKMMMDRIKNYAAIPQFLMIAYLFIVGTDFDLLTTLMIVSIFAVVFAIMDFKWIFPAELEKQALKNPAFRKVLKNQDEILMRLEKFEQKMKK